MRLELLWNPRLLCERVAIASLERRRLNRLRNTFASGLSAGHIDSLELLDIAQRLGIRAIYDIGAHTGTWTLLAKSLIPGAAIEAFEPLPAHCEQFNKTCHRFPGIRLHSVALGEKNGVASLRVTDFSDASSFLRLAPIGRDHYALAEREQLLLGMRRLDDYREEAALPMPDLIKLDVQGYEVEVLKGAERCLRHAKAVIAEVSFSEYYEKQCLFHEVVGFLADFDLQCVALGYKTPPGCLLTQTDALFVRAGLLS